MCACVLCAGEKIIFIQMPFQSTRPLTTCPHAVGNINEKKKKYIPFPPPRFSVLSTTPRLFLLSETFRVELRLSRSVTRNRILLHATEFNNIVAVCFSATSAAASQHSQRLLYIVHSERARVHTISSRVVNILFSCTIYIFYTSYRLQSTYYNVYRVTT